MGYLCGALEVFGVLFRVNRARVLKRARRVGLSLTRLSPRYLGDLLDWEEFRAEMAAEADLVDELEDYA